MALFFRKKRSQQPMLIARRGKPEQRPIQAIQVEGRRYFNTTEAAYALPKDLQEVPRLDFQHFLLRQVMRGNYIAPLSEQAQTMLDVGCGTGRWCCEMAHAFPDAQIIGIDIEEIPLIGIERPANYLFKQANVLNIFPFAEQTFDYIHQRLMLMSIPTLRWPGVLREIMQVARPHAWVELVEVGCTIWPQGPVTRRWYAWLRETGKALGQDFDLPPHLAKMAREVGLRQVQEHTYDLPLGAWAGHLGATALSNMQAFYEAMRPRHTQQLQIDPEVMDAIWSQLAGEWCQIQAYLRYYVIIGQK